MRVSKNPEDKPWIQDTDGTQLGACLLSKGSENVVRGCARTGGKTKSWDRIHRRGNQQEPGPEENFSQGPEHQNRILRRQKNAQAIRSLRELSAFKDSQGASGAMWNPRPLPQEGANLESPRTFHLLTFQCSSHSGHRYFSPTESPIINAKMPSNTTTSTMIIINFWREG